MVEKGSIFESETETSKTAIKETGSSRTKRDESPTTSEGWAEQVKDWKDTLSLRMLKGNPAMAMVQEGGVYFLYTCVNLLSCPQAKLLQVWEVL